MIALLQGVVVEKDTQQVVLNVNGVGYEVEVPLSTAFDLPAQGEQVALHTHFVVREDAQLLFGFLQRQERDMFRVLIRVNGVGPKLALAILSGLSSADLVRCVQNDEVATLVKLPGIGKKTAERLLIELRDKVSATQIAGQLEVSGADVSAPVASADVRDEAEAALVSLGYKPQDATKAVKAVYTPDSSLELIIKSALKNML